MSARAPQPHEPPSFKFGVRFMLFAVTLIAVGLGVYVSAGPLPAALLVLLFLAVLAHVAGNSLGMKMRAIGSSLREPATERRKELTEEDFAPATRLRESSPLGRAIVIITIAGAGFSGLVGALGFYVFLGKEADAASVITGGVALAVIGGIGSFIASSFLHVAGSAWSDATKEAAPSEKQL